MFLLICCVICCFLSDTKLGCLVVVCSVVRCSFVPF